MTGFEFTDAAVEAVMSALSRRGWLIPGGDVRAALEAARTHCTPAAYHAPDCDGSACSVRRSDIDPRTWMTNLPNTDVATGIQAGPFRLAKLYVEEKIGPGGEWVRLSHDLHVYRPADRDRDG